jgi:hypothetical protein
MPKGKNQGLDFAINTVLVILVSVCKLLLYEHGIDFCMLVLSSVTWPISHFHSKRFSVNFLRFLHG